MWTGASCLTAIFLTITALIVTLALRSAWQHRYETPLTPLRIVLLVLAFIGAALAAVMTRTDWLLVPMIGGVFLLSVGWLSIRRM